MTYHTDEPKVKDYTEEYHALYHETLIKYFNERPFVWGTYVWNFFDFGSAIRDEGGVKGRNNKGLMTFDRKIKKDAFYAYKAAWSKVPFVHINSKRFIERATETINVKVYSNCDEVTLFVNGEKFNTISGENTFVFENVKLIDGQNNIKVIATIDGVEVTELNITDDVYSTGCTMSELLENEETKAVLAKYLGKMIESPMLGMMKNSSIRDLNKMLEGAFDERLVFLLDKDLCQIKK